MYSGRDHCNENSCSLSPTADIQALLLQTTGRGSYMLRSMWIDHRSWQFHPRVCTILGDRRGCCREDEMRSQSSCMWRPWLWKEIGVEPLQSASTAKNDQQSAKASIRFTEIDPHTTAKLKLSCRLNQVSLLPVLTFRSLSRQLPRSSTA
jgi:hypothetical protein